MLDNQNMLLKANKVQIIYLKTENGFVDLKVIKDGGQTFDYDMETKSENNAVVRATRKTSYGDIGEQLDEIYKDIDAWKARIKKIKDDNPKE